jgi:hypothetical protein
MTTSKPFIWQRRDGSLGLGGLSQNKQIHFLAGVIMIVAQKRPIIAAKKQHIGTALTIIGCLKASNNPTSGDDATDCWGGFLKTSGYTIFPGVMVIVDQKHCLKALSTLTPGKRRTCLFRRRRSPSRVIECISTR